MLACILIFTPFFCRIYTGKNDPIFTPTQNTFQLINVIFLRFKNWFISRDEIFMKHIFAPSYCFTQFVHKKVPRTIVVLGSTAGYFRQEKCHQLKSNVLRSQFARYIFTTRITCIHVKDRFKTRTDLGPI